MTEPSTPEIGLLLPQSVEALVEQICVTRSQQPPSLEARRRLAALGEHAALDILYRISASTTPIRTLTGFILFMANKYYGAAAAAATPLENGTCNFFSSDRYSCSTPPPPPSPPLPSSSCSDSPHQSMAGDFNYNSPFNHPTNSLPNFKSPAASPTCSFPNSKSPLTNPTSSLPNFESPLPKLKSSLTNFVSPVANPISSIPDFETPVANQTSSLPNFVSPVTNHTGCLPNFKPPVVKRLMLPSSSSSEGTSTHGISYQLSVLSEIEFRKAFLVLSYIGSNKLENVVTTSDADDILSMKNTSMIEFESCMWDAFGQRHCSASDRSRYVDWDPKKTHLYYCHVSSEGTCSFKGPYLNTTKTHLQRVIGDENVLIVKFANSTVDPNNFALGFSIHDANYRSVARDGILVGLRRFHFFVFKDGGKEEKKKNPSASPVKCYFIRMESIAPFDEQEPYIMAHLTVCEARSLFMHVHMVSSMAKYMARFSLILSKTIKLPVNLDSVHVGVLEDIPCRDDNESIVYNEDGEPLIHTDGTGYISEDLARKCPEDFHNAKFLNDEKFERLLDHLKLDVVPRAVKVSEAHFREPPLLIQCRLFNNGMAVKGTLLVNKKLPPSTIKIRPSMIKVEVDSSIEDLPSFNSLEVVAVSHRPKTAQLSKNLIALLSYGRVPKEYFEGLLKNALEDSWSAFSNKRAALRVSMKHGDMDDGYTAARMIFAGIPLSEPSLQYRLSVLSKEERKGLKGGKLSISESFYLMGSADPTGILKNDEVCVILDNGQISGKLLVYRNPGLHFGDIHVLNAVYVKDLEDIVGNAKYGIFFSTKGRRSVAQEIANGDFDGDMYWVSRNPELLKYFQVSVPWRRLHITPHTVKKKPRELSAEELQHQLFNQFLKTREPSHNMGTAADSWLAFMDQLLMMGDENVDEKRQMEQKMHRLIDIYYDALDAPKSGKTVVIPDELKAKKYPHHMEKKNVYHSTSVLGMIYDAVESYVNRELPIKEIWKLPHFDIEIPERFLMLWRSRYDVYRKDMSAAMKCGEESKQKAADEVVKKYKQLLYDAPEFEGSRRDKEEIFYEALAIYHVTYNHAISVRDVRKCGFAWKVAGPALCEFHIIRQSEVAKAGEKPMMVLPSVLREILN